MSAWKWVIVAAMLVALNGCGGSSDSGTPVSNNWDEMRWDEGKWN